MAKDTIVTNMGKVTATAKPSGAGGTPIELFCTSQSLPGFQDAPTWTYVDNNPNQEVALTEAGKSQGMNSLDFRVAYSPSMLATMVAYQAQGKKFEIEFVYDHEAYNEKITIVVHDCFLLNPGSSETTEINGVAYMDVKFQPRGGGKLAEVMTTTSTPRT